MINRGLNGANRADWVQNVPRFGPREHPSIEGIPRERRPVTGSSAQPVTGTRDEAYPLQVGIRDREKSTGTETLRGPSTSTGTVIVGIDTGGTNVDAVVLDDQGIRGRAKVSNRQTRESVRAVLSELREETPEFAVDRVVVATTLVVNAAVQRRLPSCTNIVIPGPGLAPSRAFSGAENHVAAGAVDHRGRVTEPATYADEPSHDVRAVTAKFSHRNPELERKVYETVGDDASAVALGNESGAGLTFPDRVATTVANARSMPVFSSYERAVEQALADVGIEAPIYYLKGDGSMLGDDAMLTTPAHTIRSGSAASALGLTALTGIEDGLAVDIGGTTTDVARILGGFPDTDTDVSEGDLDAAYSAVTASSLPIGGDTLIEQGESGVELADERIGDAVAFGGDAPTLTDALHALDVFTAGDTEAAIASLKRFEMEAEAVAATVLEEFESRVASMIDEMGTRKTDALAVGGVLAPHLGPRLLERADRARELHVPSDAAVAGAVGCGVARVSVDTAVRIDSPRGVMTITSVGPERVESVEEGERFTDSQARKIALDAAKTAAEDAGGDPDQPTEILAYDRFSVVERSRMVGQIITARARVIPAIDRTLLGGSR